MAPPPGTLRVSRYFLALFLILGLLYLLVALPGHRKTPKLGIDLVGGIRVIFTAIPPPGEQVTGSSLEQARQILEDRVNATGVTASTVQVQGDDQLVVLIPGGTGTDVERLGEAAKLNFRPVIAPAQQVICDPTASPGTAATPAAAPSAGASGAKTTGKPGATKPASPSPTESGNALNQRRLIAPSTTPASPTKSPAKPTTTAKTTKTPGKPTTSAVPTAAPQAPACVKDTVRALTKADPKLVMPTTEAQFAKLPQAEQQAILASLATFDCETANRQLDKPNSYYIACEDQGKGIRIAYLLGQVIVPGQEIDAAQAVAPSTGQGGSQKWTVSLTLKDKGDAAWGKWTAAHNTGGQNAPGATQCSAVAQFPCSTYVAFTLDGRVISAPSTNSAISGTATQISGGDFTQKTTNDLANQLRYGALPLSFKIDSNERVSATLGTSQLKAALLAGGIGLILVVIYSLLYYRGLGLVTIASLLVSGVLTYAMMVILGEQIGFTLDLAGIAGLIVALGITADSFVVFFERLKDEVHEGRSVRVAVPRAWVRARRTILSADTVSFLAAAILYYFASADVKGFAFTLGLSTILDLVVVFLFTHPVVSLLSRSKAFGSPRFTGLNSVRAGGIAQDREESRAKRSVPATTKSKAKTTAAGTVVLDKTADVDVDVDADVDDDIDVDEADDVTTDESVVEPSVDDGSEPPRRHTTPEAGTAAERAAARRARQRQKDQGDA